MKGVVFDFGNVLYSVDYMRMARRVAGERSGELFAAFVGSPLQIAYETGRADLDAVRREVARLGFPIGREEFLDAYLDIFDPVPGAAELLTRLARTRPLGLLSNTSLEHARLFIERVPEYRWLKASVYSFELGCMKPDRRLYLEAARRVGLPPEELAYVDDIAEYAQGATAAGMAGLAFTGVERLRADLRRLGFEEAGDA